MNLKKKLSFYLKHTLEPNGAKLSIKSAKNLSLEKFKAIESNAIW